MTLTGRSVWEAMKLVTRDSDLQHWAPLVSQEVDLIYHQQPHCLHIGPGKHECVYIRYATILFKLR